MDNLIAKIQEQAEPMGRKLYVVGGAVRDLLMGREAPDLDLAVDRDALTFGHRLAVALGGRFIVLDEDEQVGRLACQGAVIDLAAFRARATTIDEDLARRDFTVNAMAIPLQSWLAGPETAAIIDPCGGQEDLGRGIIRLVYDQAAVDDPLRILRAFRLQAVTGFRLDDQLLAVIQRDRHLLCRPAPERISTELHLILESTRAAAVVRAMVDSDILGRVCPELMAGAGVEQPASHHLDVLGHNLAALAAMDDIIGEPGRFFPATAAVMQEYLASRRHQRWLRWAALCHDLAKPHTQAMKKERITFYQHDTVGARLFTGMARRLRLARLDSDKIALLISQHMRPFHLCNVLRKGSVSAKACLRLAKRVGDDLPGLFLLAMADSLAGQGEAKPQEMEEELAELFAQVHQEMVNHIAPLLAAPPLLTGHDLIEAGLTPGPIFKRILDDLQQAQVAGEVTDRAAASRWLADYVV